MANDSYSRAFSNRQYLQGRWNTHNVSTRNPLIRAVWNYISFKRNGVSVLAHGCANSKRGVDLGCGNGAYTNWLKAKSNASIISVDFSFEACCRLMHATKGLANCVCADACCLPFRENAFDFFFTIDMLGHIETPAKALDEMLRISQPGASFFIHSECSDYRQRWPDKQLMRALENDILAQLDGHSGLMPSARFYKQLSARFTVNAFFSPAGVLGWLMGYPEKYLIAFKKAKWYLFFLLTALFAVIKKMPAVGLGLRLLNAFINRVELYFGIVGGGSCFAFGSVPQQDTSARE